MVEYRLFSLNKMVQHEVTWHLRTSVSTWADKLLIRMAYRRQGNPLHAIKKAITGKVFYGSVIL